jgi:hypothetical protein
VSEAAALVAEAADVVEAAGHFRIYLGAAAGVGKPNGVARRRLASRRSGRMPPSSGSGRHWIPPGEATRPGWPCG